jgi:hypothetical protein
VGLVKLELAQVDALQGTAVRHLPVYAKKSEGLTEAFVVPGLQIPPVPSLVAGTVHARVGEDAAVGRSAVKFISVLHPNLGIREEQNVRRGRRVSMPCPVEPPYRFLICSLLPVHPMGVVHSTVIYASDVPG